MVHHRERLSSSYGLPALPVVVGPVVVVGEDGGMDGIHYTPRQMMWAAVVGALRAELEFYAASSPIVELPDGRRRPVHSREALAGLVPGEAEVLGGLVGAAEVLTYLPVAGDEQRRTVHAVAHLRARMSSAQRARLNAVLLEAGLVGACVVCGAVLEADEAVCVTCGAAVEGARDETGEESQDPGLVCHNCAHGAHYSCDGFRWTVTVPTQRVACECAGGPHYDPKEW